MTTATTTERPITKKQAAINDRTEAMERLREWIKPGDTVYCILRHRSSSGMSRRISFAISRGGEITQIDWLIARALDYRLHEDGGLKVSGCGMDMGFHVVYNLSRTMFRDGFTCIGERKDDRSNRCPSNDHSNGDRDYTSHNHTDGGYALRSTWL